MALETTPCPNFLAEGKWFTFECLRRERGGGIFRGVGMGTGSPACLTYILFLKRNFYRGCEPRTAGSTLVRAL